MIRIAALIACVAFACAAEGRWALAIATAYCPCARCCDGDGITATGTRCAERPYGIAVDPRWIAYGTRIWIPSGYGYLDQTLTTDRWLTADDTGAAMRTTSNTTLRIDLRYRTHASARRFGVRVIPIWISP